MFLARARSARERPLRRRAAGAVGGAVALTIALALPSPSLGLSPNRSLDQYVRNAWSLEDGLPHNYVTCFAQSPDGFMWIGTRSGLVRFDGVTFVRIPRPDAREPDDESLRDLVVDRDGHVWGITRGDLLRVDDDRLVLVIHSEKPLTAIAPDPGGGLWLGTTDGLFAVEGGRALPVVTTPPLGGRVHALAVDAGADLWIAAGDDLARLHQRELQPWDRTGLGLVPGAPRISRLHVTREGDLLVGTQDLGIYRITAAGQMRTLHAREPSAGGPVRPLQDRHGNVWATSDVGLWRVRPGDEEAQLFTRAEGLGDERVQDVFEDREGSLWVATINGLHRFHDGAFARVGTLQGLPSEFVTAVAPAADGASMWIGSRDRGVVRWPLGQKKPGTLRPLPLPALRSEPASLDLYVRGLLETPDGSLWVATLGGLLVLRDGGLRRDHAGAELPRAEMFGLAPTGVGDGLWVIGVQGVWQGSDGALVQRPFRDGIAAPPAGWHAIVGEQDGAWISGWSSELVYMPGQGRAPMANRGGLPVGPRRVLHRDVDGDLWVGLRAGLARVRSDRTDIWTRAQGLPIEDISQIAEDDAGHLWLGAINGIVRVRKQDLSSLFAGQTQAVPHRRFGPPDGLPTRECVLLPGGTRDRRGRLWFATTKGAVLVDPGNLHDNPSAPLVKILSTRIDDGPAQPFRPAQTLRVQPGTRQLVIDYTALAFRDPPAVRFRHRLVGFDSTWTRAGKERSARYTNLPPGDLRFEVLAENEHGVVSQAAAVIALQVLPPFHKTTVFFTLATAGLVLLVWGLFRVKALRVRRRFAVVVAERNRIARDLHDNLDQHLFAIGLQLDLARRGATGDGANVEQHKHVDLAQRLLETCKTEARRSIQALRSQVLEETGGDLRAALLHVAASLSVGTEITVAARIERVPRRLTDALKNELLHVGQELMGNAIRHGAPAHLAIEVSFTRTHITLQVKDDGKGFDAASILATGKDAGHFGLIGVQERAKSMGGTFSITSRTGNGTSATVAIPFPA